MVVRTPSQALRHPHTQPGEYKLADWLHVASDILTDRTIVNTITYKAKPDGPNITKDEAVANSNDWTFQPEQLQETVNANLDSIPACEGWNEPDPDEGGSSSQPSSSQPTTPQTKDRRQPTTPQTQDGRLGKRGSR